MVGIKDLIIGYSDFYNHYFEKNASLYDNLVYGQSPKTMVIACSDSRVDPSIIMNTKPGDIFVVRNVANIIPPYQPEYSSYHGTSAALEFAVHNLNVENIIVLGHWGCAGVKAMFDYDDKNDIDGNASFIVPWVNILSQTKNVIEQPINKNMDYSEKLHLCEKESIIVSLDNLLTFPWIYDKYKNGDIQIFGWYFSIKTGAMEQVDLSNRKFVPIDIGR